VTTIKLYAARVTTDVVFDRRLTADVVSDLGTYYYELGQTVISLKVVIFAQFANILFNPDIEIFFSNSKYCQIISLNPSLVTTEIIIHVQRPLL